MHRQCPRHEDEPDVANIRRLFKRLEDRTVQLNNLDETVMAEMVTQQLSPEEVDEEVNSTLEYRDRMNDIALVVNEKFKQDNFEDSSMRLDVVNDELGKSRYKLPKIEMVKFDGSPNEWLSFWSQFKGIHEDRNLSDKQKFQYLIQATATDSPARRVVGSFPPTAENYPKTIKYLK